MRLPKVMIKTDYKQAPTTLKWKLPLAFSLLAFLLIFKLSHWFDQDWVEPQITLPIALPETEVKTPEQLKQNDIEWQTFTIRSGHTLAQYFQEAGLESKALQDILALRDAQHLKRIYPGQTLRIDATESGQLKNCQFDIDPLTTLIISQSNGKLLSHIEHKPIEKRVAFGGGKIFDSFFMAGKQAKLDDALILELASVFAYDIDFALDIQPHDHFKVLFEEYFVNGVKVGNGPIVAAEFVNNGKEYRAIRYTDGAGLANYYAPNGQSLRKAFIRTPVQYTRISSHFNLQRRHPILHHIRAHKGVDYAAPVGTPVKAAGQGKVIFAGKKGGYGNAIIVQHGPKYTTLYGHLSRFAKSLKVGHPIKQGQIIGFVGQTGLASGPHLHYEFRINGVHHDPLTVPLPKSEGVSPSEKPKFLAHANNLLHMMSYHGKTVIAQND